MSLVLSEAVPVGLTIKIWGVGPQIVYVGDYEIPMKDFCLFCLLNLCNLRKLDINL